MSGLRVEKRNTLRICRRILGAHASTLTNSAGHVERPRRGQHGRFTEPRAISVREDIRAARIRRLKQMPKEIFQMAEQEVWGRVRSLFLLRPRQGFRRYCKCVEANVRMAKS